MDRCGRCGETANTTFYQDTLAMTHGGGTPYCERCVAEVQLDYAVEQRDRIPGLYEQLRNLGGRAERLICGYTFVTEETVGGTDFISIYCILDKGHDGDHQEDDETPD